MGSRPAHAGGKVAIAAALPMELKGLRRRGAFKKAETNGVSYLEGDVRGTGAALFVSGIGKERAYSTARAACRALPLKAYICVGLAGSLSPSLKPGDVAVGVEIADPSGREYQSDRELAKLAVQALAGYAGSGFGSLLALDRIAVSASEKNELARSYNCIAMDMESAGAARAALEEGVPFIAIRAVSDALDENLPVDFNRFTLNGAMDWPRLILHVLTHPATIGPLMRLGRNSKPAVENLSAAVERLVGLL